MLVNESESHFDALQRHGILAMMVEGKLHFLFGGVDAPYEAVLTVDTIYLIKMWIFKKTLFIPLLFCLVGITGCQSDYSGRRPPTVQRGVLDLREWEFSRDGAVRLDGEWEFYWSRLLRSKDSTADGTLRPSGFIHVPGIWNDSKIEGSPIPGHGYATYRMVALLKRRGAGEGERSVSHENAPDVVTPLIDNHLRFLAIRFRCIESAFNLFINGKRVTSVGSVGIRKELSRAEYRPQIAEFIVDGDRLEIVIQVSNFHHRKGGPESSLYLGTERAVRELRERSLFIDVFLFGVIIIMAFYHLGLFLLRKEQRSPLCFSLFCFFVAARTLLVGDYFSLLIFPNIDWELLLKLEYISAYMSLPFFLRFSFVLFPEEVSKWVVRGTLGICLAISVFTAITPVNLFSHLMIYFQLLALLSGVYTIFCLVLSIARGREGAICFLAGGMALFLTAINDILYNNHLLGTTMLLPFGLFIFIFAQAFLLSSRFSKAFFEVEELSRELENHNIRLESGVKERTRELARKNDQLKQLVHILCHDLQNPLANLKGIIDLDKSEPNYLLEMKNYVEISVNSGLDIINLVKKIRALEEEKISLTLEGHVLSELLNESIDILSQSFLKKGLTLRKKVPPDHQVMVEKASFINSVLNNILSNAAKFSFRDSTIDVSSTRKGEWVVLSIKDHGIGMSETLLVDIFDLNKATSRPGTEGEVGTGFGMPLVKRLIEVYGGTIEIISTRENDHSDQHGTEVRLYLRSV